MFTHPPHYGCAAVAARALAGAGVEPVLAVERSVRPPRMPWRVLATDFPRRGNLNGRECVLGILETLADVCGSDRAVLKVDSDTVVLSVDWLARLSGPGWAIAGCCGKQYRAGRQALHGPCYAVAAGKFDELAGALPGRCGGEDVALGEAALRIAGLRVEPVGSGGFLRAWSDGLRKSDLERTPVVSVFRRPCPSGSRVADDVAARMEGVLSVWNSGKGDHANDHTGP